MRTVRLPDIQADHFLVMCTQRDQSCHYIETRRCQSLQVGDEVTKLLVIPITSGNSGTPVSITLPANDGYTVGFRQAVDVTVG